MDPITELGASDPSGTPGGLYGIPHGRRRRLQPGFTMETGVKLVEATDVRLPQQSNSFVASAIPSQFANAIGSGARALQHLGLAPARETAPARRDRVEGLKSRVGPRCRDDLPPSLATRSLGQSRGLGSRSTSSGDLRRRPPRHRPARPRPLEVESPQPPLDIEYLAAQPHVWRQASTQAWKHLLPTAARRPPSPRPSRSRECRSRRCRARSIRAAASRGPRAGSATSHHHPGRSRS